MTELDALDTERLDFLIEHRAYVVSDDTCRDGYWLRFPVDGGTTSVQIGEYETPREAFDAARAAQEGREAHGDTLLQALCRAIVLRELGPSVEVPDEYQQEQA